MKGFGCAMILLGVLGLGMASHHKSTGRTVTGGEGASFEIKKGDREFDKEIRNEFLGGFVCIALGAVIFAYSGKSKDDENEKT